MIVGIDLGTTNSLVAIFKEGKVQIIPNALGVNLTPSAVGLDDNGQIMVGQSAKERMSTHPELTATDFKRYMGTDRQVSLGKKRYRAEELSSFVIRALKEDAEAYLGEPVTEAIITVPAYFSDAQRKATKLAGELAGLTIERLLNEPTAAAMAYGLHTKEEEGKYLVFDLGGGTFDVSILEMFDGMMEVHASAGDNHLGGTDFTALVAQYFITNHAETLGVEPRKMPEALKKSFSIVAEKAKREVGDTGKSQQTIQWQGKTAQCTLDSTIFEKLVADLLERISKPIRGALRDAKLMVKDINEIVLVGGATRMPCIRQLATRLFQRFPATGISPDEVVVEGAAVQAGLKLRDATLNDVVMTDVCPYTLGIEVVKGHNDEAGYFDPIIERNNYIPVSRVERFYTLADKQTHVEVKIYQGESPHVKDNIFLGQLTANDIPEAPAGQESIDVRFTYDINGILEVIVTVTSTGSESKLITEENPGVLSKSDIEAIFKKHAALKIHPRDQQENVTLLNRAERLYRESLGDERDFLSEQIAQFEAILKRQQVREITEARKTLEAILDQLEGSYSF